MATQVLRGNVILPDLVLERALLVVDGGIIAAVEQDEARYRPTIDAGDGYIAPGFIDVHTHGIAGADTMDATPEALATMARRFARHGVTGFLPTTVTQSRDATLAAVREARRFMDAQEEQAEPQARILGLHLEGPWIARDYKGAQNERYIAPPSEAAARDILDAAAGALKIVTLAPEVAGAEGVIHLLRAQGVYVSIGHTGAAYEQARRAVEWGATQVTHCFNAMTPLHHREPGVVGAALLSGDLTAELIADGVHVHPEVMRLLIKAKGRERVMLVTDSMSAADLSDGTYALGGQEVYVREGQARLGDGTLAGSTLTFDRAVRNLVTLCAIPLHDAVYMGATVPAIAIGLGAHKGKIAVGYDADLVVLTPQLIPTHVMLKGALYPVG